MIDIHMHVIPGVDDGSGSMEESLTMLRSAAAQGVTAVMATPHSFALYKNSRSVRERFEALCKAVRKEGLPVQLYYGTEIDCWPDEKTKIISLLQDGILPTMNGTEYVLAEFDPNDQAADAMYCLKQLQEGGYRPIVAHAERYHFVNQHIAKEMQDNGFLIQCNVYSFAKEKNTRIRERANMLLQNRLVSLAGSDGHRINHRPPLYTEGIEYLYSTYDKSYADNILERNPRKLLIGTKSNDRNSRGMRGQKSSTETRFILDTIPR